MSTAAALRTPDSVLGDERIIAADSHVIEPADLWDRNLPPGLKEKTQSFPREIPLVKNPEDGTAGRASMR